METETDSRIAAETGGVGSGEDAGTVSGKTAASAGSDNGASGGDIRSKVFSGLFWKFGERITAQLVSFIVSVALARILSPDDYGAVAMVMVFITIANVFVSSGFGNALIQKKGADRLDFSSVFWINLAFSGVLYLILYFAAPGIAKFYDMPILCPVLRVLSIRIPVAAVNTVQHAYVSREMLFKRFFWSTLFGTVISGIVGLAMAVKGFGVWALVAQYLTNTITDTIVLFITVPWRPELRCSWERAKGLLAYGWKLLVSGLLDTFYTQIRNLLIGKLYTSSDLAYYNQGDKYPSLLVVNINASISSVLFPAISRSQDDKSRVKQMTRRAVQVSSTVMWPLMTGLAVVAEPLISVMLTDKWLPCIPYLRIFCFTYGLWPIHTANLEAIQAIGRSDLFLKMEIIKETMGFAVLLVTLRHGPLAIASGLIVTGILSMLINAWPNRRLLSYSYREQFSDLLPPLLLSLLMAAVIAPVSLLKLGNVARLLIQVPLGAAVYFAASWLTKQKGFLFLVETVKKRRGRKE